MGKVLKKVGKVVTIASIATAAVFRGGALIGGLLAGQGLLSAVA